MACGSCFSIDSTHFESGDGGKSKVVGGTNLNTSTSSFDDGEIADVKTTVDACPRSAITVTEN